MNLTSYKKLVNTIRISIGKPIVLGVVFCSSLFLQISSSAQSLLRPTEEAESQLINEQLEAEQAARFLEDEKQNFDHAMYARTNVIRSEIGLENDDLAAIGFDQENAEEILDILKQWCIDNASEIKAIHLAQANANQELLALNKQINLGKSKKSNTSAVQKTQIISKINVAKQKIETLETVHHALDETAIVLVQAVMTTSQLNTWASIRTNLGQNNQYRYVPNITQTQRETLSLARTQLLLAGKIKNQARGVMLKWMTHAEEQIFTTDQKTAAVQNHANLAIYKQAILDAIDSVFIIE